MISLDSNETLNYLLDKYEVLDHRWNSKKDSVFKPIFDEYRHHNFETTINACFSIVLDRCRKRDDTWINDSISNLYLDLNKKPNILGDHPNHLEYIVNERYHH